MRVCVIACPEVVADFWQPLAGLGNKDGQRDVLQICILATTAATFTGIHLHPGIPWTGLIYGGAGLGHCPL